MNRSDLKELHYITPIVNVPSIARYGILSHKLAQRLNPVSVANPSVQNIRARRKLPSGRFLHEYANLYFHARNPMMLVRREWHRDLAVLRVSVEVLDLPGVMIADGNAARLSETAFWLPDEGLARLDKERVFAEYWTDPDPYVQHEKKRLRCAEVLVPDRVAPEFIQGTYTSCPAAHDTFRLTISGLGAIIDEHLFFFGRRR